MANILVEDSFVLLSDALYFADNSEISEQRDKTIVRIG